MSRSELLRAGLIVALLGVGLVARAADDVLTLKDGTRLEGRVVSREVGKSVVLKLADGSEKTIAWSALASMEINAPPATPTPPASAPPPSAAPSASTSKPKKKKGATTTADAHVGADGSYSGTIKHECAEGDKACKEQLSVKGEGTDVKAKYESEEDCAESDDEQCTAKTTAEGSSQGVGITYSRESVTAQNKQIRGSANVSFAASALFGFAQNMTMAGGNAALSVRMLQGSLFPGANGGSWFGLYLEPSAGMSFVSIQIKTERQCINTGFGQSCFGGDTQSSSSGLFLGQLGGGLQWMYFGRQDTKTHKQSGFGLALGGTIGYAKTTGQNSGPGNMTYGPQLSFIFPKFNAATASYSSFQINFFVLPTKDFTLFLAGAQFALG